MPLQLRQRVAKSVALHLLLEFAEFFDGEERSKRAAVLAEPPFIT